MTHTCDQPQQLLDDLQAIQELLESPPVPAVAPLPLDDVPLLCDVVLPAEPTTPIAPLPTLDLAPLGGQEPEPELGRHASLIVQQVLEEFLPRIEAELRRRLEAHLDTLRQPPHD